MSTSLSSVIDGFDDVLDTDLWNLSSDQTRTISGFARIPCRSDVSYLGVSDLDATEAGVYAHVVPSVIAEGVVTTMSLQANGASNAVQIRVNGDQLIAERIVQNTTMSETIGFYDPIEHSWWKITESAGSSYFFTSNDGVTWTQRWQVVHNLNMLNVNLVFNTYNAGDLGSGFFTYIDNVNLPAPKTIKALELLRDRFRTDSLNVANWVSIQDEPETGIDGAQISDYVHLESVRTYRLEHSSLFWEFEHDINRTDYLYIKDVGGFLLDGTSLVIDNEFGTPTTRDLGDYDPVSDYFLRVSTEDVINGGHAATSSIATVFDCGEANEPVIGLEISGGDASIIGDPVDPVFDHNNRKLRYDTSPDAITWYPQYYHSYTGAFDEVTIGLYSLPK